MKQYIKYIYKILLIISIVMLIVCSIGGVIGAPIGELSRTAVEIGMYGLVLALTLKCTYLLLRKYRIKNNFLRINNTYQREQGLIIFNFIAAHAIFRTLDILNTPMELVWQIISIIIPLIILIYMEITSLRSIQKKVTFWKKSHSIVWMITPLVVLHIMITDGNLIRMIGLTLVLVMLAVVEFISGDRKRGILHMKYLLIGMIIASVQYLLMIMI